MSRAESSSRPAGAEGAARALEELIAAGEALLERERMHLLAGEIGAVAALAADKRRLAEELEARLPGTPATPGLRRALEVLVARARENERLLAAVRRGVAEAERHLRAILATARGAVAYARDGSAILGPDGGSGKGSRA